MPPVLQHPQELAHRGIVRARGPRGVLALRLRHVLGTALLAHAAASFVLRWHALGALHVPPLPAGTRGRRPCWLRFSPVLAAADAADADERLALDEGAVLAQVPRRHEARLVALRHAGQGDGVVARVGTGEVLDPGGTSTTPSPTRTRAVLKLSATIWGTHPRAETAPKPTWGQKHPLDPAWTRSLPQTQLIAET